MLVTTLLVSALSNSYADTINCNTQNSCDLQTIKCIADEPCNIFCLGLHSCSHSTINCKEGYECNILCNTTESCLSTTINCPSDQKCSINCRADSSCKYSVINCPVNNTCDIICANYCDESYNCYDKAQHSCSHSQIICPIHGHCNILCGYYGCTKNLIDGGLYAPLNLDCLGDAACRSSEIICPQNADCFINCEYGMNACSASILCPMDHNCYVNCDGQWGCYNLEIDAKESTALALTGCTRASNCQDINIYCPPHSSDKKNCFIEGTNDLFGSDPSITNGVTMTFYAQNGWNDIDFSGYSGTIYGGNVALLYCTESYSESCVISSSSWSCVDMNSICMHPPTNLPTPHPTMHPTQKTSTPTRTPSLTPTKFPTYIPTNSPSNLPTSVTQKTSTPTRTSSLTPTNQPTNVSSVISMDLQSTHNSPTSTVDEEINTDYMLFLTIALVVCVGVIVVLVGFVIYTIYRNVNKNVKNYSHVTAISEHDIEMTSELKTWIENEVGLPEYYDVLNKHGFDRLFLAKLITSEQLNEMGIDKIAHKLHILQKVEQLKNNENTNVNATQQNKKAVANDTDDVEKAMLN
eukprot:211644_1